MEICNFNVCTDLHLSNHVTGEKKNTNYDTFVFMYICIGLLTNRHIFIICCACVFICTTTYKDTHKYVCLNVCAKYMDSYSIYSYTLHIHTYIRVCECLYVCMYRDTQTHTKMCVCVCA